MLVLSYGQILTSLSKGLPHLMHSNENSNRLSWTVLTEHSNDSTSIKDWHNQTTDTFITGNWFWPTPSVVWLQVAWVLLTLLAVHCGWTWVA